MKYYLACTNEVKSIFFSSLEKIQELRRLNLDKDSIYHMARKTSNKHKKSTPKGMLLSLYLAK